VCHKNRWWDLCYSNTADLITMIDGHGLSPRLYADETQAYGSLRLTAVETCSSKISGYVGAVTCWMKSTRLQLNADKTDVLWRATSRRQYQLPTVAMSIDGVSATPVSSDHDLGIFINSDVVMQMQVQLTVSRCFAALRQLRRIRRSVSATTLQTLVVTLVFAQLDYGNGVLAGLPTNLMYRLQSVQHAAARLTFNLKHSNHITDALISLQWLRTPQRIHYKVAMLTYKVLHGSAPLFALLTSLVDMFSILPVPIT
jgi:hypothetical protein